MYKLRRPQMIGKPLTFIKTQGIDLYTLFPSVAREHRFQLLLLDYCRTPTKFSSR
ncbi:MAG: hypothetical protein ACTSRL_22470 [Candidatus Helarchaeota archaeon]